MRSSFMDYAMSVIIARALPDARDGLKPVHRRILFAMHESNNVHNRPYVKCARVVGEVLGKFHPHGDASVYEVGSGQRHINVADLREEELVSYFQPIFDITDRRVVAGEARMRWRHPHYGVLSAAQRIGFVNAIGAWERLIDLDLDDVAVVRQGGRLTTYREEDGQRVMKQAEITVRVDLHRGAASATVWTCDLSHDYVSINADYRS